MNHLVLVGKITNKPIIKKEKGSKYVILDLKVQKTNNDKKEEKNYDLIKCKLDNMLADNAIEYCNMGDTIGVKGCLITNNDELIVCVNSMTCLTTKKEEKKNEN